MRDVKHYFDFLRTTIKKGTHLWEKCSIISGGACVILNLPIRANEERDRYMTKRSELRLSGPVHSCIVKLSHVHLIIYLYHSLDKKTGKKTF